MSFFLNSEDVCKDATYKVVNPESAAGCYTGEYLIKIAEDLGFEIQVLNDNNEPIIVALKDRQKFEYEQKKAKKNQEKKSRANIQKVKEVRFHIGISDNDIKTKVAHINEFLKKNCKVKVVMELRGREADMTDLAKEKFDTIINMFSNVKIDPVKKFDASFYTFISNK